MAASQAFVDEAKAGPDARQGTSPCGPSPLPPIDEIEDALAGKRALASGDVAVELRFLGFVEHEVVVERGSQEFAERVDVIGASADRVGEDGFQACVEGRGVGDGAAVEEGGFHCSRAAVVQHRACREKPGHDGAFAQHLDPRQVGGELFPALLILGGVRPKEDRRFGEASRELGEQLTEGPVDLFAVAVEGLEVTSRGFVGNGRPSSRLTSPGRS